MSATTIYLFFPFIIKFGMSQVQLQKEGNTLKDSTSNSWMMSSCKWPIALQKMANMLILLFTCMTVLVPGLEGLYSHVQSAREIMFNY